MATRKQFILRLEPETHEAFKTWADTEFRSINAITSIDDDV